MVPPMPSVCSFASHWAMTRRNSASSPRSSSICAAIRAGLGSGHPISSSGSGSGFGMSPRVSTDSHHWR